MSDKDSFAYMKAYKWIKEKIDTNIWEINGKIPSEKELMGTLNLSRDTVRKALLMLSNEGYISRQAGSGTFVLDRKLIYKESRLESFSEQMLNMGLIPSSEIHVLRSMPPSHNICEKLKISSEINVYKLARLRKANGEPVAYEILYTPESLCTGLENILNENSSIFEIFQYHYKYKIEYADVSIESDICPIEYINVLKESNCSAILKVKFIVHLENDKPVFYITRYYRGDKFKFALSLSRKNN